MENEEGGCRLIDQRACKCTPANWAESPPVTETSVVSAFYNVCRIRIAASEMVEYRMQIEGAKEKEEEEMGQEG